MISVKFNNDGFTADLDNETKKQIVWLVAWYVSRRKLSDGRQNPMKTYANTAVKDFEEKFNC